MVKSRSVKRCKKKCEKRAGAGERQGARLIFALLVLYVPILSESLAQARSYIIDFSFFLFHLKSFFVSFFLEDISVLFKMI